MLGRLRKIVSLTALIAALVAIAVMTGCGSGETASTQIVGTVMHDGNRSPLEGIEVTDNKTVTTTAADGSFSLERSSTDATTLYVLGTGYEVEERELPAGDGVRNAGAFYLKPVLIAGYGGVKGIVADAGRPVAGATVYLGGNTAITDSEGRYTLYNVPSGYRTITATTGLKSGTVSVLSNSLQFMFNADIAVTTGPPSPI